MTMSAASGFDLDGAADEGLDANVRRFLAFRGIVPGEFVELQALDVPQRGTKWKANLFAHAATVDDVVRLLKEADGWGAPGVYFVANRVDPAVATRRTPGGWHEAAKGEATTDKEIDARCLLFVDIDADRPKGTSSTDAQLAATHVVALAIRARLVAELRGEDVEQAIAIGHSGNGRSIFLALDDVPETPELSATIKGLLAAIRELFETEAVKIDPSVSDAKRLVPAFGSMKRKGAPGIPSRPHRRSAVLCEASPRRLSAPELDALLISLRAGFTTEQSGRVERAMGRRPAPAPRPSAVSGGPSYAGPDVFRAAKEIPIGDVLAWLGLGSAADPTCPGCGLSGDSSVSVVSNGLKCSHARCADRGVGGLPGFRTVIDVVCEARGVDAKEAVALLADRFNTPRLASRTATPPARSAPRSPPSSPGPDSGREAVPDQAADLLQAILDRLEEVEPKAARTAAALSDSFLDSALTIGVNSVAYARLVARLPGLGVKVNSFKAAVKARRQERAAAARDVLAQAPPDGRKPSITVSPEELQVNDAAIEALARLPMLYQRAHGLVSVVEAVELVAGETHPVRRRSIRRLEAATIRELLTQAATWQEWMRDRDTGESQLVQTHPPEWSVRAVHARGQWTGVRHLTAIAECPVMRPDGSILCEQGWDPATGILLILGDEFPAVPTKPTRDEVIAARDLLLDVVRDFPFESGPSGVHAAAWLAGVLTVVGRYAFAGPSPLFVIDANSPGAGKSLAADAASIIVTGRDAPRMTYSEEEELAKRITCIALDGDAVVLLDNIDRPLGDAVLDAALTSTEWGERVLGSSTRPKLPLTSVWWATGNNITFKATISRRSLLIRLDCKDERPAERTGLRDLKAYCRENRPALVTAALTLLRAWEETGRDLAELDGRIPRSIGSYEQWGALVQGAVMFAGLPDPGDAIGTLDDATHDQDAAGLQELLLGWEEATRLLGGGAADGITVQTVLAKLQDNDEARRGRDGNPPPLVYPQLREAFAEVCSGVSSGKLPNARQVGYAFRRLAKRVSGGRRLVGCKSNGKRAWRVEVVGGQARDAQIVELEDTDSLWMDEEPAL